MERLDLEQTQWAVARINQLQAEVTRLRSILASSAMANQYVAEELQRLTALEGVARAYVDAWIHTEQVISSVQALNRLAQTRSALCVAVQAIK